MARHDGLDGYPNNATATAAAHMAQAANDEATPYRVWQCAICSEWHAEPWLSHPHDPELAAAASSQLAPA